ncbi:DUF4231 domain-containing protein [Pseudoalteromonas spongiae]|uniref:DUF4231 domain-containing protein n=1 Tax=Pseudoalteromonas spongiae TaxID=298657 RepID=UPI00110B1C30|nr:DUF4231 domain-containing protein [Pseudoalteromonas spongiae]TMO84425.1 DUF4231 domain-containing protein [Pseudoalteromonas spongiae]
MSNEEQFSARKYGLEQLEHFKLKASHNKFESLWCFRLIMVCTLSAPLFVSLTDGFWTSKVTPSVLSAIAAFSTAWLQLRKPQELWSLYRGAERVIENQITHYDFLSGLYKDLEKNDADQLLVEKISQIKLDTHKTWKSNVPNHNHLKLE